MPRTDHLEGKMDRLEKFRTAERLEAFLAWYGVCQLTHDQRLIQERIERDKGE